MRWDWWPTRSHTLPTAGAAISCSRPDDTTRILPKPSSIPFSPTEENVDKLESWLRHHFYETTFNTEKKPLPVMAGKPHHIHLVPNATPHAYHTPATVPRHWEAEVKAQLDEDVKRGVIQPVLPGEATDWNAKMVAGGQKDRPAETHCRLPAPQQPVPT